MANIKKANQDKMQLDAKLTRHKLTVKRWFTMLIRSKSV